MREVESEWIDVILTGIFNPVVTTLQNVDPYIVACIGYRSEDFRRGQSLSGDEFNMILVFEKESITTLGNLIAEPQGLWVMKVKAYI